jgi:hypothetical protein
MTDHLNNNDIFNSRKLGESTEGAAISLAPARVGANTRLTGKGVAGQAESAVTVDPYRPLGAEI